MSYPHVTQFEMLELRRRELLYRPTKGRTAGSPLHRLRVHRATRRRLAQAGRA